MVIKQIAWNSGTGNITLTYQGQGDGTIVVSSDPNNLDMARSQVINIKTTVGSPVIVKNFTISQGACPFPVGDVRNFAYTGSYQEVELPAGRYKLQCWGAQGGSNAAASNYNITAKAGGKGGYSEGIITLSSKTIVRVYVGGQGSSSAGGFNGGGSTTGSTSYDSENILGVSRMGGGGGASDIRLSDGALLSRMIVAGGGAGGAMCYMKDSSVTYESGYKFFTNYSSSFNSDFGDSLVASFSSIFQVSTKIAVTSSLSINNVTSPNGASPCCLVFNSSGSLIKVFIARIASTQSGAYVMNITYNDVKDGAYIRICNDVRNPISTSMSITYISGYNYFKNWVTGANSNEISSWHEMFQVSTKITVTSSLTVNNATSPNGASPCCILYDSSGSMIGALFARIASTQSGAYVRNITYDDMRSASYIRICNDTRNPAEVINSTSTDSQVGGVGGGTQGGAYSSTYAGKQNASGSGGSFGQGANQSTTNYRYCSGAGGGGWYGGGGGKYSDSDMDTCKQSGGGSGFVNTAASSGNRPSGYTGPQLDSGETRDGTTSFPSTSGGTEVGHSGHGYARITRIS